MKKAIPFLFLFHFLILSSIYAQPTEITNGLNYLTSTQNPDGSWKDDPYSTSLALRIKNA